LGQSKIVFCREIQAWTAPTYFEEYIIAEFIIKYYLRNANNNVYLILVPGNRTSILGGLYIMNLQELFKIHELMENHIKTVSNLDEDMLGRDNLFDLRFLALQVKIGELANLTKCYKYARIKDNLPKEKLMIRYIDAMKFLLSIGNINEFNIINFDSIKGTEESSNIIKVFSNIFEYINEVRDLSRRGIYFDSLSAYMKLFAEFIKLAKYLGLTMDEVYDSYQSMVCEITQSC
jgi:dimeric dUTPase (all-alpha-NTP-PPase superfamily)